MAGKDITVVLAGVKRSGKSTLFKNLHGKELGIGSSSNLAADIEKDGTAIHIIDGWKQNEGLDVLVYCMPVSPGCKFHDGNPELMKSLQNIYGKEIWEHCVVVFTFSNLAWDRINSRNSDPESTSAMYKEYIEKYLDLFRKELVTNLGVSIDTATVFSTGDQHTIPAIPAGDAPQDPVLPGVISSSEGWRDRILKEFMNRRSGKIMPLPNIKKYLVGGAIAVVGIGLGTFSPPIVIGGILILWLVYKIL